MELNQIFAEAVRYRKEIGALLDSLDPVELEQGLFVLKASLLNGALKPFLLSQAGDLVQDYRIAFENGHIQIGAAIDAKQLGPIEIDYKITISEFRFGEMGHKLYGTFSEVANPTGNMVQKIAFKAALLNGPLLKTALKMGNIPYVHVDGNNLMIDFDRMGFVKKIPDDLNLGYLGATGGELKLSFV